MTQTFNYISLQDSWTVDLSNVRRSSVTLTERAEQGQPGDGSFSIDDGDGTAGHSSDGIVGLKTLTVEQDACSVARIFSGFVAGRAYGRGDDQIFTAAVGRQIDVSLVDLNAKAGFMRITGTDGKRPAETVDARMTWILGSSYVGTLYAASSYNQSSSVTMDAADYRGQTPGDVHADCALAAKGFNWFIFYNSATAADEIWFANSNTSTSYTSTIKVSNVAADVDSTATFAPAEDWKLTRSPDRVVAGVDFPYSKGSIYETRAATALTFAWRDGVAPTSTVKTEAAARAIARQFLWENHTEEDRLTVKLRMRAAYVNLVRHGMRMQVKLSNEPAYTSFTYFRVLSRTVTQPLNTDNDYDVELELSPQEAGPPVTGIVQSAFAYIGGVSATLTLPAPVTPGNLLVYLADRWKGNGTSPVPPNTDIGAGNTIGGTGAWTSLHAVVQTTASGDRSMVQGWYKTATATENSGPVFSAFTFMGLYEIAGLSVGTVLTKTEQVASGDLDAGSLGSPTTGQVALMIAAQYCGLGPDYLWTPSAGWVADQVSTWNFYSSERPYWQGHALGTGAALEARVDLNSAAGWCAVAVLLT